MAHPPTLRAIGAIGACLMTLAVAEAAAEPDSTEAAAQRLDCGGALALSDLTPVVQHRDGDELHQYWLLADDEDLWQPAAAVPESLLRYRQRAREVLADTTPLGLIRTNRERNTWLERDYPAEREINRLVEGGVGTFRPMNCLETQLLAYQAARFPLYEQPTEVIGAVLRRATPAGGLVKLYMAADGDAVPPKPGRTLAAVEVDLAAGWRFSGVFHNHTFGHDPDRGLLPVAAPSSSDLHLSRALVRELGLESIQVTDGFSTIDLAAAEVELLARAAQEAQEPAP